MNTTIAIILTVVVTNWVSIGEFKDKSGATFDVQEGRTQTNTVAKVLWDEQPSVHHIGPRTIAERRFAQTNEFVLKSVPGPVVGERRVAVTNNPWAWPTNQWWAPQTNPYHIIITPTTSVDATN